MYRVLGGRAQNLGNLGAQGNKLGSDGPGPGWPSLSELLCCWPGLARDEMARSEMCEEAGGGKRNDDSRWLHALLCCAVRARNKF